MMSFSWFRRVARSLNHSRPWWWRGLVHTLKADRWAWWVEPGNEVQLHPRAPWLDLTLRGQGHRVVVEPGATLRGVVLDIVGDGHHVLIRRGCVLNQVYIRIRGRGNRLEMEENVRFTRGGEIWLEDEGSRIRIGRGTTIVQAHLAAIEGTTLHIGEDCLFAYQIEVRTGDSHSILEAATGRRQNPSADVVIGPRVWVGARALILKGTRVPPDSVVAAAAVVTQAFDEPGVVLAGHPARIVKRGIRWTPERVPVDDEYTQD